MQKICYWDLHILLFLLGTLLSLGSLGPSFPISIPPVVLFVSHLSSFCGVKPWLWLQIQYSQQTSFKFVYQSSSLLLPVSHSLSLFSSSFFCPPRRGYVKLHEYYLDIKQYSILEYMKNGRSKKRGRNIEGKGREK